MRNRFLALVGRGEVQFLLLIFASFALFFRESRTYPAETRSFPELVILAVLVLCGVLLLLYVFAPSLGSAAAAPEDDPGALPAGAWPTKGRFFRGWLSIAVALATAYLFGFLFLIPASFVSYVLLLGRREMRVKVVLLSVATMVVVYFLFHRFLGIPTMNGAVWRG